MFKFHVYHHYETDNYLIKYLLKLNEKINKTLNLLENFQMTQDELVEQVKAIGAKLAKIGSESSATLAKVEELKVALAKAIEDGGKVSQELQDAVAAVAAQAQVVDDLVPDVA